MRYLVDRTYYNSSQGPILFYTGNEGGVWGFYNNSGFMTKTLAKRFGALVVFAEHRYYGESMPFGNQSFNVSSGNLRFLTIEQVMMDFVDLQAFLK
jgi:hypothetical protein